MKTGIGCALTMAVLMLILAVAGQLIAGQETPAGTIWSTEITPTSAPSSTESTPNLDLSSLSTDTRAVLIEDADSVLQSACNDIEQKIAKIDALIPRYSDIGMIADVDKLITLRAIFEDQLSRLADAASGKAVDISDIIGDVVSKAPISLIRMGERIEFAGKLSQFASIVAGMPAPADTSEVAKAGISTGNFKAQIKNLNESIQAMTPREQIEKGITRAQIFFMAHDKAFYSFLGGDLGDEARALATEVFLSALLNGSQLPDLPPLLEDGYARNMGGGNAIAEYHSGLKAENRKKVLIILMEDWLDKDIGIIDPVELYSYTSAMFNNVDETYVKMSYGKMGWEHAICEARARYFTKPAAEDIEALLFIGILACEMSNGNKIDLKQYDAVVVFPGAGAVASSYSGTCQWI